MYVCEYCSRKLETCICDSVDDFFKKKAYGVPREKPTSNVVYASFEIGGKHRIFRLAGDKVRRVAS